MAKSERIFCYRCATRLEPRSGRSWYCSTCDYVQYDNPRPCAEVAVFNKEAKLLISKRAFNPGKGKYDMPGGFAEMREGIDETALRELAEETGYEKQDISDLKYVKSFHTRYKWPPENYNNVVTIFMCQLLVDKAPVPADDSEEMIWISEDEIDVIEWSLELIKHNVHEVFKFYRSL